MKNVLKLTGCLLLAAIMGLSSCVKTEVAPEVAQIRQAQVALLNAQVTQILATANQTNVNSRYTKMNIYFDSLSNVIEHQRELQQFTSWSAADKAQLEQTLLNIENRVTIEQQMLQQNMLAEAQATAAYERFINQGVFQQNVSDLLGKYSNEINVLNQLYQDRITLTKQIATEQLLLDASTHASWDFLKSIKEDQLVVKEGELAAAEAALTKLEAVYDDPATLEAAKTDLAVEIKDLADQNAVLDVEVQEALNVKNDATLALTTANAFITKMDHPTTGLVKALKDKNAAVVTKNAEIVTATADVTAKTNAIAAPTQNLALANADLASATSSNNSAVAAYNTKLALWNTANTALNNAQNDYDNKVYLQTIAANNLAADPTNPALVAAKAAADAAVAAALTVLTNATTAEASAKTARDNAQTVVGGNANPDDAPIAGSTLFVYNAAVTTAALAQTALNNANSDLATAQATLVTKNNDKAQLLIDIEVINDDIAFIQADYNAAVANQLALQTAVNDADNAWSAKVAEEAANTAMSNALNLVLTLLGTQYTNLTTAITAQKTTISNLELAIATLNSEIGAYEYNKTESEGKIARWEEILAYTASKITESEGIVAYYKKLLDEAIAAGA